MPITRLTLATALVFVLLVSGPLQASTTISNTKPVIAEVSPPLFNQLQAFNPAVSLAQSIVPSYADLVGASKKSVVTATSERRSIESDAENPVIANLENIADMRQALIGLAMNLRDIRYVRGGRDPSTGFDCSGFVRYVFAHAIGMQLPTNSASQFLEGLKVKRADMKPGDLVFFHTHGKRAISHVGIYIANGEFIHSPTTGKSVQISSLDENYWAKHFAGAKRPEAIAVVAHHG